MTVHRSLCIMSWLITAIVSSKAVCSFLDTCSVHGPLPGVRKWRVVDRFRLQLKDTIPHGDVHLLVELQRYLVQRKEN